MSVKVDHSYMALYRGAVALLLSKMIFCDIFLVVIQTAGDTAATSALFCYTLVTVL